MRKITAAVVLLIAATVWPVAEAAVRVWVSTTGIDNAECSLQNPCRNFNAAITAVSAGGEVVPLDSGGYGAFTVDKSVTVVVPGGIHAAIAPTSGTAITVNAGATDAVVLRGLYLNSHGATHGIEFDGGESLHVEKTVLNGFFTKGIVAERGSAFTISMFITDTTLRRCGTGIDAYNLNAAFPIHVFVHACRTENNFANGILANSNSRFTVTDTVSSNSSFGFRAVSLNGMPVRMTLEHCVAMSSSNAGVSAGHNSTVHVSNCTVTNGNIGFEVTGPGAVMETRENNTVRGNTTPVSGTLTPFSGI